MAPTLTQRLKRFVKQRLFPEPPPPPTPDLDWAIGIYVGASPLDVSPAAHIANPVLTSRDVTDARAAFVADPFMLRVDTHWYMFFELMNRQTRKGEIGLATSADGANWTYRQIVLAEPFHLSYPYVFAWQGDYYMIPESSKAQAVRLYRADPFPTRWTPAGELLTGAYFADASIVHFGRRWWLFVDTSRAVRSDTLRLYHAADLHGPWVEHPCSPLVEANPHIARPAGRVIAVGDRLIRYAQDCYPVYGLQVRPFEITDLTPTSYQERAATAEPILTGSGAGWNQAGMHHIDPHRLEDGRWIACVDGWRDRAGVIGGNGVQPQPPGRNR